MHLQSWHPVEPSVGRNHSLFLLAKTFTRYGLRDLYVFMHHKLADLYGKVPHAMVRRRNRLRRTSPLAENCGLNGVALHARTREQGYSGNARWEYIGAVKNAVRTLASV